MQPAELNLLLLQLCALPAIVVVDEAYAEFAAVGQSAVALTATIPNLIVMRTFSKWAGLAGLRVGYSVAQVCTGKRGRVRVHLFVHPTAFFPLTLSPQSRARS